MKKRKEKETLFCFHLTTDLGQESFGYLKDLGVNCRKMKWVMLT